MFAAEKMTPPPIKNIFSPWKLETFNCLLAIAMVGSMYGILQRYDGQPVPDWNIPINLSTLIAIITVIFRTSLVLILAELIGQAKWKYFVGNGREDPPARRLIETSHFNNASQGLFGALKLIPTIMGYPDILMAIMVMIISLATGSFVQQAIQTLPCQISMDSIDAFLPISRNITSGEITGKLTWSNVLAATSSALTPDNNEIGSPISAGCSTGNCTFQNPIGGLYNTLGVCSLCTDTSSLITSTKWTCAGPDLNSICFSANYTLPNGLSVMFFGNMTESDQDPALSVSSITPSNPEDPNSHWVGDLDWAGGLVNPEMRALSQWAWANVTILTSNWLPTSLDDTGYLAVTCTVYPCLRTYNASVTNGKLDDILISTVPVSPNINLAASNYTVETILTAPSWIYRDALEEFGASFQAVQTPCLVNHTVWTEDNTSSTVDKRNLTLLQADPGPNGARHVRIENITAPTECIYSIDLQTWYAVMDIIETTFNGSCSAMSSPDSTDVDCEPSNWLIGFYNHDGITTSDVFERFQAFTDRLSNKIRMGLLGKPEYIFGQTLQTTVCVRIGYEWLAFPSVLVFITTSLLAWTMLSNWRRRSCDVVWKASILPFLFYSERFVVQNGEDVSAESTRSSRGATKETLMDLDQMQSEAKQQVVRFNLSN